MQKTVGDLLREARNKQGLALQTIERSTGIATHNLLAIELDQFSLIEEDKLDQYLRIYAEAVDLDYQSLGLKPVSIPVTYESTTIDTEKSVSSFDELVKSSDPDYVPMAVKASSLRRSGRLSHSEKPIKSRKSLILTVAFLAIGALSVGFVFLYKDDVVALLASKRKTETLISSASSSAETVVSSAAVPEVTTQLMVTGGGEAIDVAVVTTQKPVKITISLSGAERSWVGLSNSDLGEGGTILSSEQTSYTATIKEGSTQAVLSLGITQGVTIKVNDQLLDISAITSTATSTITFNIQ